MTRRLRWLVLVMVVGCVAGALRAQTGGDIRFEELKRPGVETVRQATSGGFAADARSYMQQFVGSDSSRIEERRSTQSSGSSAGSSSSSESRAASSQKAPVAQGNYVCDFRCTNAAFVNTNKTPMFSVAVTARHSDEAFSKARDEAQRQCRENYRMIAETGWGTPCKKR